jgi:Ni/Co efflux regulator RcnB
MAASRRTFIGQTFAGLGLIGLALAAAPAVAQDIHPLPRRGDHLPPEVQQAGPISNYAAKHLRKPPVGYGWYQIGRAYVMASVATGLITEVVIP